jgi:hypothetical protein
MTGGRGPWQGASVVGRKDEVDQDCDGRPSGRVTANCGGQARFSRGETPLPTGPTASRLLHAPLRLPSVSAGASCPVSAASVKVGVITLGRSGSG